MKNIIAILTVLIFSLGVSNTGFGKKVANKSKKRVLIIDEDGYFKQIQDDFDSGKLSEKDFHMSNIFPGDGKYHEYSFTKDVKVLGIVWPAKSRFSRGAAIYPSKNVMMKGYLVKGHSKVRHKIVIYEKDLSVFYAILAKDTEMTIKGITKICPANSQFSISENKPEMCCMGRECKKDEWGVPGFYE